jgi:hypothetical protein
MNAYMVSNNKNPVIHDKYCAPEKPLSSFGYRRENFPRFKVRFQQLSFLKILAGDRGKVFLSCGYPGFPWPIYHLKVEKAGTKFFNSKTSSCFQKQISN